MSQAGTEELRKSSSIPPNPHGRIAESEPPFHGRCNPSCGYSESGFNVTLSDAAIWDIHRYQVALGGVIDGPLTGTWQPDGRRVNPLVSLDTTARTTSLEPLGQMNPNGSWTLFIADVEAGGTGRLVDWEVRGTPRVVIPEPRAVALLAVGAGLLGWVWRNRRTSVR